MGISSRPAPRTSRLEDARATTAESAGEARARGLLTRNAMQNMIDGKVSMKDVHTAEKILDRAAELSAEVKGSDDFGVDHLRSAEDREWAAEALLDAVKDQYDIQKERPGASNVSTK